MDRLKKYIFLAVSALASLACFVSCSDGLMQENGLPDCGIEGVSFNPDGTMNVTVKMEIPDMPSASTRSMGETPNYDSLGIHLLVFEEGEGLKQVAHLSAKDRKADSLHDNGPLVTFNAKFEPTEKTAVIHLVATDQPGFSKQINFGMEERVMTSLYTDGNHEAYWQRIPLGSNIPSREQADRGFGSEDFSEEDEMKAAAISGKLNHILMIRNFCKVSVKTGDAMAGNGDFVLTGFYVLNTVDRGSVVPFVAGNEEGKRFVDNYADLGYRELTDDVNYVGHLPSGITLINMLGEEIGTKSEDENGNPAPVYFYERPARVNSTERTYVIVKGRYDGNETFYKIDLGHIYDDVTDADEMIGLFEYYNLLRNFDYEIRINSVYGEGYSSLEEAARGVVFNNFSASVEARNMKSISDGYDMIHVSFTSYVFTSDNDTVTLFAQYRENIGNGTGGVVNNTLIKPAKGSGDVIKNYTATTNTANSTNAYNKYFFTSNAPTDELKRQEFYVYRGNKAAAGAAPEYGLFRIVTLFLHKPWQFRHIDTFPGLWESPDDMPEWDWSEEHREIGQSKGSPLTLFFELPPDLPQALFPLEFVIESDRQNIQNAYQGNAVVRSVPASESLFKDGTTSVGTPVSSRIQYVKTVTWKDYYGEWSDEQVGSGSVIVRCRFLTITDLAQDGIGGSGATGRSETILRVYNPYFANADGKKYHQDGFIRDTETSDPSPRFWDFSSGIWDQLFFTMNDSGRELYTADNNVTDELIFVDGGSKPSFTNAVDGDGFRYVKTSNANDKLKHTHTYSTTQPRKIRLAVMSTDGNGNSAAPGISFSNVKGGTMKVPDTYTATDSSGPYTSYIYDITVPAAVTELDLDIAPPAGNPNMRFYQIDFWPRWDEYEKEASTSSLR